jgi:hypothetical protein
MNPSFDEIKNMSDEEVAEMNKKLAGKVVGKFLLLHTVKWVVIVGSIYAARKFLESKLEDENEDQ